MLATDWNAVEAVASGVSALVSAAALGALVFFSVKGMRQTYSIVGAQFALAWREQVMLLAERGFSADEIRRIVRTERGWDDAAEHETGSITEIVDRYNEARTQVARTKGIAVR